MHANLKHMAELNNYLIELITGLKLLFLTGLFHGEEGKLNNDFCLCNLGFRTKRDTIVKRLVFCISFGISNLKQKLSFKEDNFCCWFNRLIQIF